MSATAEIIDNGHGVGNGSGVKPAGERVNVSGAERWVSAIGGGALTLIGLSRRSVGGAALALAGGSLIHRGVTGHCYGYQAIGVNTADPEAPGIRVRKSVTVNASPEELYRFWRRFENLPRFMKHLESVQELGGGRSHWVAKAPAGKTIEWDAEITAEEENRRIAWRSTPDAEVSNAGEVRFAPAPGGRGTEITVSLEYNPPGGVIGAAVAKLFGEEPQQQVSEDLRRFKQVIEAGETPTTEGQPHG